MYIHPKLPGFATVLAVFLENSLPLEASAQVEFINMDDSTAPAKTWDCDSDCCVNVWLWLQRNVAYSSMIIYLHTYNMEHIYF